MTTYERIKAYLFRTHGREPDIKAFLENDPDWQPAKDFLRAHEHAIDTLITNLKRPE